VSGARIPFRLGEAGWSVFPYPFVLLNSPALVPGKRDFELALAACKLSVTEWELISRRGGFQERLAQFDPRLAALVRDVLGNPFRPVVRDPAWQTPSVLGVAWAIEEEGRFQDLPILADALEEAGCANDVVLSHCRSRDEHVCGCWIVRLILGNA
jgi:hypothetical protein